jgi:hypothetical protein
LVTQKTTSPRRISTNNAERPQYTPTTPKVKLLDSELLVKTLVVTINPAVIKTDLQAPAQDAIKAAKFLLYYGKFTLCGVEYNIPLSLLPCNPDGSQISINKFGLPSKYISLGIYIGKTYDYSNQVCPLYDEQVKHVKIATNYEYTFCGHFYDNIWPFGMMKQQPAPMQVSPAGASSVVIGGKLNRKHTLKIRKHNKKQKTKNMKTS